MRLKRGAGTQTEQLALEESSTPTVARTPDTRSLAPDTRPLTPGTRPLTPDGRTTTPAVILFCDGACSGNPGPGGWGTIIDIAGERAELSGGHPRTTNNKMELQAVIEGFRATPPGATVHIVTDSEYVAKGITSWLKGWIRNGWRTASKQPVKNQDQWEQLNDLLQAHPHKVEWVRGHNGHPENERCDELARAAIRKYVRS